MLNRIRKWNEERYITKEGQAANITANLLEEYTEFARAKDDFERIDALCDIVVFSGGLASDSEGFSSNEPTLQGLLLHLAKIADGELDELPKLIALCKTMVEHLGFDFAVAMDETLKEIESRKGVYSQEKGKFNKFLGAYSKKDAEIKFGALDSAKETEACWVNVRGDTIVKWYKADYARARVDRAPGTLC